MRLRARNLPIGWRITGGLLTAAILPLAIVSWLGIHRGKKALEEASYENLQLTAQITASRLDQIITDMKTVIEGFRRAPATVDHCEGNERSETSLPRLLALLRASDDALIDLYVTDLDGIVTAASRPTNIGRDLSLHDFWKAARAGHVHVSSLLIGKRRRHPGVYFAGPVPNESGEVIGVAVFKYDGQVIRDIVDEVHLGEHGRAALYDENKVILAHGGGKYLFHSLEPLSRGRIERIDPMRRWGLETIPPAPLASATLVWDADNKRAFRAVLEDEEFFAGVADLKNKPWRVLAYQRTDEFTSSLDALFWQQITAIAIVLCLAALFAFKHSRSILRPVRKLADAAARVAQGDFGARADIAGNDEIGQLAHEFNRMVPQLESGIAMRQALELAQEVQANLLPTDPPRFDGLDCAGVSISADQTGGDYFDFIDLRAWDDDRLAVTVGDVVGHGVAAALLMATARGAVRSRARPLGELNRFFDGLNKLVCEDVRNGQFMSLLFLVFDPEQQTVRWVNAGHNPPIRYCARTGQVDERPSGNPPLGVLSTWKYEASAQTGIEPGDVFLLGTDGIWEYANAHGEMYGHERLRAVLREHHDRPAQEIVDRIHESIRKFGKDSPQQDDVTIVVVRVL